MDIGAALPKSGSTTWADEVEAEEAEFGQAPLPIDSSIHRDRYEPVSPIYGRNTKSVPPQKRRVKIPDAPPYRAFIGNVAYNLTEAAVEEFLGHTRVVEILITRYRDTGKAKGCYIEFQDVEDLKALLDKDGQTLAGRDAHVQVAQPRDRKPDARRNTRRPEKGRKDPSKSGAWEPPMPTEESLKARPVLKLKPRSQKIQRDNAPLTVDSSKSNPFGGARPADTASKLAELEIRDKGKVEPVEAKEDEGKTESRETGRSKDSKRRVEPKGPEYFKEATVLTKIDNPFDLLAEDDA